MLVGAFIAKSYAPGEARTHGLEIMRLTRCLLRYRGWLKSCKVDGLPKKHELLMLEWVSPLAFLLQSILKRYPKVQCKLLQLNVKWYCLMQSFDGLCPLALLD